MRRWILLELIACSCLLFLQAGQAFAEDRVVFGGSAEVAQNEVVDGDLVVFGGKATISGHITGDAVVFGGKIVLEETGVVDGDLVALGGSVDRKGKVGGNATSLGADGDEISAGISRDVKEAVDEALEELDELEEIERLEALDEREGVREVHGCHSKKDGKRGKKSPIRTFFDYLRIAYMALIGILILLEFSPDRILNITRTIEMRPGRSLLAGLLTATAFGLVMLLFTITLIGAPVAALIYLALWVVAFPGVMGMCGVIARKLPLGRVSGSTGAWLLGAVLLLILPFVGFPIGWFLFNVLFALGLGAAVISRFGIREPGV